MTVTLSVIYVAAGVLFSMVISVLYVLSVIKAMQLKSDLDVARKDMGAMIKVYASEVARSLVGTLPAPPYTKGGYCGPMEKLRSNLERLAVKVGERREQLSQQMQRFVSLQSEYCLFKSLVKKADAEMFEVLINQVYEIRAKADADVPPQMDTNQGAQMPTNKDGQRPDLVPGSGENVNTAASACCSTVGAEG